MYEVFLGMEIEPGLMIKEFLIFFYIVFYLAIVLIILNIVIRIAKKNSLFVLLPCGTFLILATQVSLFFMRLQQNNGNPDSGQEAIQWFIPLGFSFLFCLIVLSASVVTIARYFTKLANKE